MYHFVTIVGIEAAFIGLAIDTNIACVYQVSATLSLQSSFVRQYVLVVR